MVIPVTCHQSLSTLCNKQYKKGKERILRSALFIYGIKVNITLMNILLCLQL